VDQESNRKVLERRLAQARRLANEALDPITKERLTRLAEDIEGQLRSSK
jgi:hypothetical protein